MRVQWVGVSQTDHPRPVKRPLKNPTKMVLQVTSGDTFSSPPSQTNLQDHHKSGGLTFCWTLHHFGSPSAQGLHAELQRFWSYVGISLSLCLIHQVDEEAATADLDTVTRAQLEAWRSYKTSFEANETRIKKIKSAKSEEVDKDRSIDVEQPSMKRVKLLKRTK